VNKIIGYGVGAMSKNGFKHNFIRLSISCGNFPTEITKWIILIDDKSIIKKSSIEQ